MIYNDFKEAVFAEAKNAGFSDWEIYYTAGNSFSVKIFGGEIAEYTNADSVGVSFRGTYNGRIGYAFTEKLDNSIIAKLVKSAADNATVIEEEEIEKLYKGDKTYPTVEKYNPALDKVSTEEKLNLAFALEKAAYARSPKVKSVDYCQLGTAEYTVNISNSYGVDLSNRNNFAYAYVMARIEDVVNEKPLVKTGFELWHGNDLGKFSCDAVANAAVDRGLSYLGAESVKSDAYPVIFDNRTARDLIGAFSSVFFAENAQKGFSLLANKENETIAAPFITLRDDGVCEYETFGGSPFDSEGVATQQKAVIENGVLKTLLYNTKSANKANKKSTGNGFKPSFRASVATSCTNFYISPSNTPFEDLYKNIKKGILITEIEGLHAGLNPISGDFSISSDGFLIEDGKITKPVEQITVAGNFYSLLKEIEAVGSDLAFNMPSAGGAIGSPSILVSKLPVSGL